MSLVGVVLLALPAFVAVPGHLLAADPVTFGEGSATSTYGQFIDVKQPVTLAGTPQRVEVLIETPGGLGPSVVPLPGTSSAGSSTLDYRIDLTGGHIVPNTTFIVRFRVVDGSGTAWLGPAIRHTYDDDRFDWKVLQGNVVRVHWVEGNQAFGQRALKIGDDAVAATAKLLGVTETDPIDFFIYADQQSFYDALGPATRENVGGQAHPDIRTLFALITPAEIDASWVESVVPHELTHVVFATAVDNPYHDPPHWLNEGLAVYLADGYQDSDRSQVEQAAKDGSIIPLDGLAGAFPTTRERFFLAYAESVSAVDRIVRVSGRDALVKLIRSYHDGVSDDAAFQSALGRDVAGFQADWLAELGATSPVKRGPQPAPVGPLPSGWGAPQPDPSFEVVGSLPPTTPSAPIPTPGDGRPLAWLFDSVAILGIVVAFVAIVVVVRMIRRRSLPVGPDDSGDNRLFGRGPTVEDRSSMLTGPGGATGPGGDEPSRLWGSTGWTLPQDPETRPAGDVAEPVDDAGRSIWAPNAAPAAEQESPAPTPPPSFEPAPEPAFEPAPELEPESEPAFEPPPEPEPEPEPAFEHRPEPNPPSRPGETDRGTDR
jgi:peptidase MA superfamily protein